MNTMGRALVRAGAATCVVLPAMALAATAVSDATASAPPSTAAGVDLDAAVADFVGDEDGGAVALVVRDGVTTVAAAGVANSAGDRMTTETSFRVGSLSKSFVATMVMQLVDEGGVALDATLSTYLTDTPVGGDVRIRDLLRHRSGVPSYTDVEAFFSDALGDLTRVFTPDEVLEYVAGIPAGEPDQQFVYSNTNYLLLGQLIEHVDGTDLNAALANRITGPLGLEATRFDVAHEPAIDGLAGGWHPDVIDGDPVAPYDSISSGAWAAGALVSTAGEVSPFLGALFGGELISAAALAEMTMTEPDEYGLGLGYIVLPSGTALYGHDGEIFGYLSFMAIEPLTGNTLVILTNNGALQPFDLAQPLLADW